MDAHSDPEIGKSVQANGLKTNYLEQGGGFPVILLHGSGPGVTGYANWRFALPVLAQNFRAIAPDAAGFGYTERKSNTDYTLDYWIDHIVAFMDALDVPKAHLVGNSFGGALALAITARHPERVDRLVLMGSVGVGFDLTEALDFVWGYEPSIENMRRIMDRFAHNRALINEDLIASRYRASVRPGFHESYSSMFPAPRQRHIERLATPEDAIRALTSRTLIVHGRDDQIIPVSNSLRFHELIENSELHLFGQCGHWTQIEKKERFNRLVLDFLLAD